VSPPTKCKSCGANIVWIKTAAGKSMPCSEKLLTVITATGSVIRGRESHFASCGQAKDWRKKDAQQGGG